MASRFGSLTPAAMPSGLHQLDRVLTLPVVFMLLTAAALVIAWNRGVTLVYALLALMLAAEVLSLAGTWLMLRPARVRLALPREASVGERISVALSLDRAAWPPTRWLLQFSSLLPFAPEESIFLTRVSQVGSATRDVRCARRGHYDLREGKVRCAYPFGLAVMERLWPIEPVSITVFPRVHPVVRFALSTRSARSGAEMERPIATHGAELFREVRDYLSGDNLRHIHWRSTARQGRLMVKEFDAMATGVAWIVLDLNPDNHAGVGEDHSFERAVEIAATIATHWLREGLRCGLAGGLRRDGAIPLYLPPQNGAAQLRAVLSALAEVSPNCQASYGEVLAALAARTSPAAQWVLFAHDRARIALPPSWKRDASPLWLRFDTASFAAPGAERAPLRAPARNSDGFVIGRDSDLALLFR